MSDTEEGVFLFATLLGICTYGDWGRSFVGVPRKAVVHRRCTWVSLSRPGDTDGSLGRVSSVWNRRAEGHPEQPRWGCVGQACGATRNRRSKSPKEQRDAGVREGSKRSETTTEGLSAMPTEGESVAYDRASPSYALLFPLHRQRPLGSVRWAKWRNKRGNRRDHPRWYHGSLRRYRLRDVVPRLPVCPDQTGLRRDHVASVLGTVVPPCGISRETG